MQTLIEKVLDLLVCWKSIYCMDLGFFIPAVTENVFVRSGEFESPLAR